MANIALLIAGGSGNRMGQDIPKQFMHVEGCPIIILDDCFYFTVFYGKGICLLP